MSKDIPTRTADYRSIVATWLSARKAGKLPKSSVLALAEQSGLSRQWIERFLHGETSATLSSVDRILDAMRAIDRENRNLRPRNVCVRQK